MIRISNNKSIYKFSPSMEPVLTVKPGDVIKFETNDCFYQQISQESQLVTEIDFSRVNPATGPIFVEGAQAGDLLKIRIMAIDVHDQGVGIVMQGGGILGAQADQSRTRIFEIKDGFAHMDDIKIPLNPMIGVIGTAPADEEGEWITAVPWKHGGNMDTTDIKVGSSLYLPVRQEGALLALGDCHAAMGDGEVSMAALEIPADVIIQVDLVKAKTNEWPLLETADEIMVIASGDNVDQAIETATSQAVGLLEKGLDISWEDAYILASLAVDIRISQVVNEKKTVRAAIPKSILSLEQLLERIG